MIDILARLLYPPKCIFCDTPVENDRLAVCDGCRTKLSLNNKISCAKCGAPLDTVYSDGLCPYCRQHKRAFRKAYVPLVYEKDVRLSLIGFKFHAKRGRGRTFATLIYLKMKEAEAEKPDMLTFVPLHPARRGMRGYNQAELIARPLGALLGVPVVPLLRKVKNTPPQAGKGRRERLFSLGGVFGLRRKVNVSGKNILLIDDILTTGATLNACAGLLKKAGAKAVSVAAAAATPYPH